jgi:hypothetical protein
MEARGGRTRARGDRARPHPDRAVRAGRLDLRSGNRAPSTAARTCSRIGPRRRGQGSRPLQDFRVRGSLALLTVPEADPQPCGEHLVSPSCSKRRATGCVLQSAKWAVDVTQSRRKTNVPTLRPHVVPHGRHKPQSSAFGYSGVVQPHFSPRVANARLKEGASADPRVVVQQDGAEACRFRIRRTEPPLVQPNPDSQMRSDHLADCGKQGRALEVPAARTTVTLYVRGF